MPTPLEDRTVVVTGATGQVGLPVAVQLAATGADVWAPARFSDPGAREALEAAGVHCVVADLASGDGFDDLPAEADSVVNFAVAKTGDPDRDLAVNAESVALLMQRYADARAFLHCSSTAVYAPSPDPVAESSPLGDNNHRHLFPTYVFTKIAAEAVARATARLLDLPTVVARLNVPYGDNGGWPWFHLLMLQGGMAIDVAPDGSAYHPIHEDDIARLVPHLLDLASVPATTVNLAGTEEVRVEDWVRHIAELTGLDATFEVSDTAIEGVRCDTTRLQELLGDVPVSTVAWQDGIRRMLEAKAPDALART